MLQVGLALALASAFATNVGFLLRHRGAVAAPDVDMRHPLRSAVGLFRSKWWTIGYVVAAVAYALHVGALALAPLSLVQAVLAGGLVLLGVLADRFFGFHLGRREWAGVVLAAAGLAFLALTGGGEGGTRSADYSLAAMLAWESALVAIGTVLIVFHRTGRAPSRHGVLLGVAAGLLFTVTHVAVKAATGETLSAALLFGAIAVVAGVIAFFASARSLQVGEAVAVIAVTSIASNASAIPAGIVVFGDPLGDNAAAVAMRSLAFALVVVAAALIPGPVRPRPRSGAAERRSARAGGRATPPRPARPARS
jgi:drug/metabolite transporter (DMT)-like permease